MLFPVTESTGEKERGGKEEGGRRERKRRREEAVKLGGWGQVIKGKDFGTLCSEKENQQ